MNELAECFNRNLLVFDRIFILLENADKFTRQITFTHEKSIILPISVRPTFKSFYECINNLPVNFNIDNSDDINIVANSDIYFEEMPVLPKRNQCWGLTRYEVKKNGPITFVNRKDCTDSWVFLGHVRLPKFSEHWMGVPGCDNRQNWELMNIGYEILNPSLTFKTFHIHEGDKSYDRSRVVNRPYHFLTPIELNQ